MPLRENPMPQHSRIFQHFRVIQGGKGQTPSATFKCPKCGAEIDRRNLGKVMAHEAPHTKAAEVEGASLLGPLPYESD